MLTESDARERKTSDNFRHLDVRNDETLNCHVSRVVIACFRVNPPAADAFMGSPTRHVRRSASLWTLSGPVTACS